MVLGEMLLVYVVFQGLYKSVDSSWVWSDLLFSRRVLLVYSLINRVSPLQGFLEEISRRMYHSRAWDQYLRSAK
jgi:hypothetical protein